MFNPARQIASAIVLLGLYVAPASAQDNDTLKFSDEDLEHIAILMYADTLLEEAWDAVLDIPILKIVFEAKNIHDPHLCLTDTNQLLSDAYHNSTRYQEYKSENPQRARPAPAIFSNVGFEAYILEKCLSQAITEFSKPEIKDHFIKETTGELTSRWGLFRDSDGNQQNITYEDYVTAEEAETDYSRFLKNLERYKSEVSRIGYSLDNFAYR